MPKRLLIVEHEPSMLRALEGCLRVEGFDVTTARTSAEALLKIAQSVPDLVLTGVHIPGMSGYELAQHLRKSPRTALVPIVLLTARTDTGERIEGFRAGVDGYVIKPFVPDELVAIIKSILSRVERTHAQIARLIGSAQIEGNGFHDEKLTVTENRIAASVARGLTNKEIAAEMEISVRTVENHVSHILDKKHFHNRVEIARYVMQRGA